MKPKIMPMALTLGSFLSISFALCVVYDLIVPSEAWRMYGFWEAFLPGFKWISLGSFIWGLFVSLAFGAYAGVVLVPLYNFFHRGDSVASH